MLKTIQYFREIPISTSSLFFNIFLWFVNIKGSMPKNNRNCFFIQVWSKFHVNFIYLKNQPTIDEEYCLIELFLSTVSLTL